MEIDFYLTTYCKYGGGLRAPLNLFHKYLSDYLSSKDIVSNITKIEITFAYPPYIIQKNLLKGKDDFWEWYNKLPYSRFAHKRTAFNITIPFPELSEYLEKDYIQRDNPLDFKYVEQPIDDEYRNKTTVDIFRLLLDKMIDVFDIIKSKLKKSESFDLDKLKECIEELRSTLTEKELIEIEKVYKQRQRNWILENNRANIEGRKGRRPESMRLIYDIRLYYTFEGIGLKFFDPYDGKICNRILDELRKLKFKCPGYTHLYISVSDSYENALYRAVRVENWFVYGLAVLENPKEYEYKEEKQKKRIVFDLIKTGLLHIAKVDNLDLNALNTALNIVEQKYVMKRSKDGTFHNKSY